MWMIALIIGATAWIVWLIWILENVLNEPSEEEPFASSAEPFTDTQRRNGKP
jgi:hypothetical protein